MDQTYQIHVNDQHTFDVTTADLQGLDKIQTADQEYHLLKDNQSYRVKVIQVNFEEKLFELEVNDRSYTVTIADEFDQLVKKLGLSKVATQQINTITAPMPGLVLEVNVMAGQQVNPGDGLLILEAMKMENVIKSAGEGVIKAVHVAKGEAVEKGALLVELE